ncbi:hypothetical protein [Amaricoccus macauensis]|uniref:hypothetical protein n=1 Tax=Amaricoccus macauensis TaxID=57001 RepID=UPI003C7C3B3C
MLVRTALNGALIAALLLPSSLIAQPIEDPNWPCVQRKVTGLSVGLMWPHPLPDSEISTAQSELADALALRRVSLADAESLVADFMQANPETDLDDLGLIFEGVFDHLAKERRKIMAGIERYASGQHALSQRIDQNRMAFRKAEASEPPDYDRLDELEAKIDWDERIFRDRAQSLTYVCETPVLLERRLYAIAQMLLNSAP